MYPPTLAAIAAVAVSVVRAASPAYLQLDVHRRSFQDVERLARRQNQDGSIDAVLTQNDNKLEYLINITVGTPPQPMAVTLDTGSSDLWIPAVSSQPCEQHQCNDGSFNPSTSSTYNVIEQGGFNITYAGPGDSDAGNWATETITVGGGPSMSHVQIGVALNGADSHGVMGVGYDTNEAANPSPSGVYASVLDNMVSQGVIERKAYSLYLNDLQVNKGSIIFGGIDSTKYTGDLVALPLQMGPEGVVSEFYVTLTSVSFTDEKGETTQLSPPGYAQSVLLDSGTSATLLTDDVFDPLANGFGAVYVGQESYAVPCRYSGVNGTINYKFGGENGVSISVPISQVIGSQELSSDQFNDASGGCDFGFGPIIDGVSILGDTFLRSAYAVYDLDNNMAALAQAAENKTGTSSIAVIPTGTTLPGVSITATANGTQLSGTATTLPPAVPTASVQGSTLVLAGTPTFDLGPSSTAGSSSSSSTTSRGSSSGAAGYGPAPSAALLGLGLVVGLVHF